MAAVAGRAVDAAAARQPLATLSFGLVLLATYLAPGYFTYPQDTVVDSALAAWPGLLMAAAASTASFAAVVGLSRRFPALRLVAVHRRVLGRVTGTLLAAGVLAEDLMLTAVLLRSTGDLMSSMFLFLTPVWVLMALAMATAAYTAAGGIAVVGRALPALVAVVAVASATFLVIAVKDVRYPWAVLPHAFPVRAGAVAGLHVVYALLGFHQILNLRPFLAREHRARATTVAWLGFTVVGLVLAATMAVVLGTLTPQGAALFLWPTASTMQLLRAPGFFIARVGLVVLAAWSAVSFTYLAVHLWGQSVTLADLLGVAHHRIGPLAWLLAAAVWGIAVWSWSDQVAVQAFLHQVLDPAAVLLLILGPLLLAAVAAARRLAG